MKPLIIRTISLGLVVAACAAAPGASEPSTERPAGATGAKPSPSGTEVAAHPFPTGGSIEPGTYVLSPATLWGVPPVTITFAVPVDGWASWGPGVRSAREDWQVDLGFTKVASVFADPCRWQSSDVIPVVGAEDPSLFEALEAQPHFVAGETRDVVIDGWPGHRIVMTLDPALDMSTCDDGQVYSRTGFHGGKRWHVAPGQTETLWALDVEDTDLVIFSGAMPDASAADLATIDEIVASLDIEATN